jgi:FliI/YscN family ATPase
MINRTLLAELLPRSVNSSSYGKVRAVSGPVLEAQIPLLPLGSYCWVAHQSGKDILARCIGFRADTVTLAPLEDLEGTAKGAAVSSSLGSKEISLPSRLIGRVFSCTGEPLLDLNNRLENDQKSTKLRLNPNGKRPKLSNRKAAYSKLHTGISSLDAFTPISRGGRIAIVAPPGLGKTTLLNTILKNLQTDVNVIALVGERGREAREFVENMRSNELHSKTVIVVSTSEESAQRRELGASLATSIAEYYRDQGLHVGLFVDSLTRVARAIREVSLAAGELPVRQGYTASVYSQIPKLLERPGLFQTGSITAFYTLLRNSDQDSDALEEEVISLLDGHVVLSDEMRQLNIFPSIDFRKSLSRMAGGLLNKDEIEEISKLRATLSRFFDEIKFSLFGDSQDKHLEERARGIAEVLSQGINEQRAPDYCDKLKRDLALLFA